MKQFTFATDSGMVKVEIPGSIDSEDIESIKGFLALVQSQVKPSPDVRSSVLSCQSLELKPLANKGHRQ